MANTWSGITPNLELEVYSIISVLSDDITGEQLLASIINATNSNTTKIDDFAGRAASKPASAAQGRIAQFDANRNVIDSGKNISPVLGADDSTVPTSGAVKEVTDNKADKASVNATGNISVIAAGGNYEDSGKAFANGISSQSTDREIPSAADVHDYVLMAQLAHTDYQGMFDYFGSRAQVEAVPATAGQKAIIYVGAQNNFTGVQRGDYDGVSWSFVDVSPSENNGAWIFAKTLLGEDDTPFGIAVYKNDGTNPAEFDVAPFPMFKADNITICVNNNGNLALMKRQITTANGTKTVLNDTTGDNISYDSNKTVKQAIDEKIGKSESFNGDISGTYDNLSLANAATAGTSGESAQRNLNFGDSFKVLQQTIDDKGRTTAVNERLMTLPDAPTIGNGTVTVNQGGQQIASFTLNQSNNVTIEIEDSSGGANVYDSTVELAGDVGATIVVPVSAIQILQGSEILLEQTLVSDAGFNGAGTGGTIGIIISYSNPPANSSVNVKLLTLSGGGAMDFIPSTSGTNTYTATLEGYTAHVIGRPFLVNFSIANTGGCTLNINNLGAVNILRGVNTVLASGDLSANSVHMLVYDGTRFQLITQGMRLTGIQLASPITGMTRNLGTTADIAETDTILQAFGKALSLASLLVGLTRNIGTAADIAATDTVREAFAKAISLASQITGYTVGSNTVLAATDTLREALGKIQGQINARIALSSQITGYALGSNTELAATQTLLAALGNLQAQINARIALSSQITGYAIGSNTALAATQTLLAALGNLQGQINARIGLTSAITGYTVGANTVLAASDTLLQALGKVQGQIDALASGGAGGNFVVNRGALTESQVNDTRPGMCYAGTIVASVATAVGLGSGNWSIEFLPSGTLGWGMQRATGIGGTVARQIFVRTTSSLDTWSAWNGLTGGVRNIQTAQYTVPVNTNVNTTFTIPITTVASTARSLPVIYGGGGVNNTGQPAGFPPQQRVVPQECRVSSTTAITAQLSPSLNVFYGGTTLNGTGALMRIFVLEHNT